MLNAAHLESIIGIDERLSARKEFLAPIDGTPLAALVNACWVSLPSDAQSADGSFMFMKNSTYTPEGGLCEHDAVMDELSGVIGPNIMQNIAWARNVVNPAVTYLAESIQKYAIEKQTRNPGDLEIVPNEWADVWSNPTLSQMVSPYAGQPADVELPTMPNMPAVAGDEDVLALIRTGVSHVDDQIAAMVKGWDPGHAAYLYNTYFSSGVGPTDDVAGINTVGPGNAGTGLMLYLISRALQDDRPAEVDLDDAEYQLRMARITNYLGSRVATSITDRTGRTEVNNLDIKYPQPGGTGIAAGGSKIFVDGDVYRKFLGEGGTPEVLFGSHFGDRTRSYQDLLANKETYLQNWETKRGWQAAQVEANKLDIIRQACVKGLLDLAEQMPEELAVIDLPTLTPAIEAVAAAITPESTECLYTLSRDLVTRVLYPHTDAAKILCLFDDAKCADEAMSNEEATLVVVVDLLCDWVAQQITITKA